jgi:signal transduction histidine kinase
VVSPLSLVTRRATAVASGDLRPEPPLRTGDEIGELSVTFEAMVGAIAEGRERLLASERLATIGKMAAHVTHEVRNPLSSIALNLELLEEELGEGAREARTLLRAIALEVQRLSVLSDQYLSMAKRKAPEIEDVDAAEMVQSAASFMKRDLEKNQVDLTVAVDESLPWVQADPAQIRQVLFNLLRNAREAVAGGGHVWLRAQTLEGGVLVSVEDDGPGVPAERVEELFDPFFTTKDHGTGLGLAVTRQIVQAHGGRLEYRTRPEGGAHFEFWLPSASAAESAEP